MTEAVADRVLPVTKPESVFLDRQLRDRGKSLAQNLKGFWSQLQEQADHIRLRPTKGTELRVKFLGQDEIFRINGIYWRTPEEYPLYAYDKNRTPSDYKEIDYSCKAPFDKSPGNQFFESARLTFALDGQGKKLVGVELSFPTDRQKKVQKTTLVINNGVLLKAVQVVKPGTFFPGKYPQVFTFSVRKNPETLQIEGANFSLKESRDEDMPLSLSEDECFDALRRVVLFQPALKSRNV